MIDCDFKEKPTEHPLEEVLDLERRTTMMEVPERAPAEIVTTNDYDEKDKEIEKQLQEVYESAMTQFEITCEEAEKVEGKYKARNGEVAIQALNAALAAVRTKAEVKSSKDKVNAKLATGSGPNTLNQNLIVDRNELLKLLEE